MHVAKFDIKRGAETSSAAAVPDVDRPTSNLLNHGEEFEAYLQIHLCSADPVGI